MWSYLARRLLYALFVLLGVATVVFFVVRLTGDPVALMVPPDATVAQENALRHALGLDAPLAVQYVQYIGRLLRLDFGQSLHYSQPALGLIAERYPATLELAGTALVISLLVALPAGVIAATRRGTVVDGGVALLALTGQSMPAFWSGILLILLFAVTLHWLPASGSGGLAHLILPAVTLGLYMMAFVTRLLRSSLLEVLHEDYVRTARAKGLGRSVVLGHAVRNALLPVVTVVGLEVGSLLGGSVLTETVFAWPGVGQLTVQAIYNRDYPLVQAAVLVLACTFVIVNLLVDLSYALIDPRIRYT